MNRNLFLLALTVAATIGGTGAALAQAATVPGLPTRNAVTVDQAAAVHATQRPRVVVSTDIGGTDPDDFQSMVHLLVYADALDIEGLVSSPYGPGRARHIHEVINVYERDFAVLRARSAAYPTPAALRDVTKQGALASPGAAGFGVSTEGSEWIVRCARKPDPRPLWVLVWGGIEDLAQALHDAPDILPKLRVYFIGGPNKTWSIDAYDYIDRAHPLLWMIEANATYRGWFTGGNQTGEWGNVAFVTKRVAGCGALGDFFAKQLKGIKMGDTPSVMHVLGAAPDDPTQGGWGGRFVRVWEGRKTGFARLTTAQDLVEVFGTVEWTLPLPAGTPPGAKATMLIDGRIPAVAHNDGHTLRFRFSPRDAKVWPYAITSEVRELDGVKGAFTAVPPPVERTRVASARRPNWWIDDPASEAAEGVHPGAKHVNRWREDFLRDFAVRIERCVVATSPPEKAPQLAFPTAEGYGRFAQGGRGGRVIHVTNLNDSGPGSLRDAVEQSGPRTVVFDVSGLITLESKLIVRGTNSNLTIAGQTAPGNGVCLRKYNFGMLGASNVVIRYLRVRPGNISGTTLDGMGLASSENCIIDHCSISWTLDEAFSSRGARNITLQRTLISEALNAAGHRKYPPGTQHGYAASIGGDIGSFHHNLLANNCGRNWSLAGGLNKADNTYAGRLDIRNNVVFNWKDRATDGGAHEVNFVGNYYQPGPATKSFFALNAQYGGFPGSQRYYFAGNVMPGHFGLTNQEAGRKATTERGGKLPETYSPWAEQEFFPSHVKSQSADEAYTNVLADVGCNYPALDEHDKRIITEVRSGKTTFKGSKTGLPGLPDSQEDVGGWDNYPDIPRPAGWDTDGDGMPDAWEKVRGLNPGDSSDGNQDANGDGYTNLEEYLNSLVGEYPLTTAK